MNEERISAIEAQETVSIYDAVWLFQKKYNVTVDLDQLLDIVHNVVLKLNDYDYNWQDKAEEEGFLTAMEETQFDKSRAEQEVVNLLEYALYDEDMEAITDELRTWEHQHLVLDGKVTTDSPLVYNIVSKADA